MLRHDDLGTPLDIPRPVTRVVSLVPSLTEAVEASCPGVLVGATDWCTHPAGLDVVRVRGTKNPDLRAILDLRPDLVVANMEENRELDVRRLRDAGIPVWVTRIETVDEALTSMSRLFVEALGTGEPEWLTRAAQEWSETATTLAARVAVPIWRDPWMVVGRSTFTGDLVSRLGLTNAFGAHSERYPTVIPDELTGTDIDLVLLPDEPYVFTADDGPEALVGARTALVSGRLLTWYGPSLLGARSQLSAAVAAGLGSPRRR